MLYKATYNLQFHINKTFMIDIKTKIVGKKQYHLRILICDFAAICANSSQFLFSVRYLMLRWPSTPLTELYLTNITLQQQQKTPLKRPKKPKDKIFLGDELDSQLIEQRRKLENLQLGRTREVRKTFGLGWKRRFFEESSKLQRKKLRNWEMKRWKRHSSTCESWSISVRWLTLMTNPRSERPWALYAPEFHRSFFNSGYSFFVLFSLKGQSIENQKIWHLRSFYQIWFDDSFT